MNVAALLQDSPSEDHARRRQQAQQAQQQAQAQQQTLTQQQQPQPHHRSSPPSPRDHPSFPPSLHDSHRPPPLPTLPPPPQVVRHAQPPLPPAPPHRTQRAPSPEFYAPPPPHGYPPPSDYDPRKHAHRPPSDEYSSRRGPALPSPPYAVGRPPPPPPNIRPGHIPHAHTPHGGSPMYLPPPPVPHSAGPPPSSAMGMHHPHRSVDYISSPPERERERDKERGHLERERYRERDRDRERERDRDRDRDRERDTPRMPPGKTPYLPGPSGPSPPQPPQPPHQSPIHEPSSMYTGHPAQAHFAPPPPPSSARPGRSAPMASLQSDAGPGARHVGGPPPVPGPGPPPPHHSHRDLGPSASLASVGMHHSAQGFGVPGLGREESSAMAMGRERERDRDMREREREMIERDRDRAREREMVEREREGRRKGRGSVSGGRHTPIGMGLPSAFPPAPAPDPRMGPKEREREREMRQREDMDFIRKAAAQRRADEGQGPPRMERERDRDMMHALGGQQHQQIPKSKSSSSLGSSTSILNLASGPGPGLSPPKGHGDPMQHQGRPPFTPAPYPPERRKQGPGPSPPHPQPHVHHHAHAHLHAHIHHPHPKDAPPGSGVSTPHTHVLHHGHHPHPHQHHQHQLLGAYPPAHRRSPPPFHAQAYAHGPGALMPAPALPPLHLGAFVFPATPFPYHFPASPAREVRATLLIPAGFLPAERPARPRLWGGAAGAGMSAFVERRVYTDDSDIVCAAVHAGFVPWSTLARAAREGRDLRLDVRLSREVRYVGGVGARLRGLEPESVEEEEGSEDDDGRGFVSAGWGNGHDGSGFEILGIAFLEKGTAHKAPGLGRKNRKQRLAEYAEGRCAVLGAQNIGKRKRRTMMGQLDANVLEDEEARAARMSIVFGEWGEGGDVELGFKYDPDVLRSALFDPPPTAIDSPRKRRRLAASASTMDVDAAEREDEPRARDVILETACERFLVTAYESPPEEDKENETGALGGSRRRWAISLVGKAGAVDGTAQTAVADAAPVESKDVKSDESKADAPSSDDLRPPAQAISDTAPPAPPDDKEPQKTEPTEPDKAAIPDSALPALPKLLQRDITEANFDFAPDEVRILGAPDAEGVRSGWAIEVRRWRWA